MRTTILNVEEIIAKQVKPKDKFKKVVLYIVRTDSQGGLQESMPCVNCMNVIRDLNIKRVVHSTANGNICIRRPPDYESDHITMGQRVYDKKAKSLVR